MKQVLLILFVCGLLGLSSCQQQFEPVDYGHDACTHCKMTIMDKRFAAEMVTEKGKAYKFDDIACLLKYMKEKHVNSAKAMIFVNDYNKPDNSFLDARQAVYLHSEVFKTPMNGNFAAFSTDREAAPFKDRLQNNQLKWQDLETKPINQ
ncbi:copper chaperone NosL [Chitinophaga sp. YR573]|uniref:nitrous oxide reductase accessory protein NosL n=1 Tax=Chitinophaga sp. YR573 TaxID=1881040 RepID=UPI0008BF8186|nr:nitrous oxide reductase accessory protein NosL [Chitinophaga sp. YR573]SEW45729.1 copper chaperone NosL [Chitinophaga sp. YR573]